MTSRYKAFISYSHAADGRLAPALQSVLQRFAKPWYRRRAFPVFRDETSLLLTEALWPAICKALDSSDFFILLASPEAAASKWVGREVETWIRREERASKLIIVLTDGDLVWRADAQPTSEDLAQGDFDWDRTNALPPVLRGRLGSEPLWIDLRWARGPDQLSMRDPRFLREIAKLAATLRGIDQQDLIGEEVRLHRRAVRLAWSAVLSLVALLAAAATAAWLATESADLERRARAKADEAADSEATAREDEAEARRAAERHYVELLTENGRIELLGGHRDRAAAFLTEGYRLSEGSDRSVALRFLLAEALRVPVPRLVFEGDAGSVSRLVFSPDGKSIAAAGADRTVTVWEAASGEMKVSLRAPSSAGGVGSVAWSPDGKAIAASGEGVVEVWDVESGRTLSRLKTETSSVSVLEFSPDGLGLLTAGALGPAQLWDLDTGAPTRRFEHGDGGTWRAAFSGDGRLVVVGGTDGTAKIWDATSGGLRHVLEGHAAGGLVHVSFSPDGSLIATSANDPNPCVWSAKSGRLLVRLAGHGRSAWIATFSPDGKRIATGAADGTVTVWSLESGESLTKLGGDSAAHSGAIKSIGFSRDGTRIVTAGLDRFARVWDSGSGALLQTFEAPGAVFAPDGLSIVTYGGAESPTVWDLGSSAIASLDGGGGAVRWAAFKPEGSGLATVSADGFLRMWDVAARRVLLSADAGVTDVRTTLSFSADGAALLTPSATDIATLWSTTSGKRLRSIGAHGDKTWTAIFSPDSTQVVVTSATTNATVWDASSGRLLHTLAHDQPVWWAAFNGDGTRVVTTEFGTHPWVHVWDSRTGDRIGVPLKAHTKPVSSAVFSPDGEWIVTASVDGTAKLWRWGTGEVLGSMEGHGGPVLTAAFSRDGSRIATAGSDGTVRIWEAAAGPRLLARLAGHRAAVHHVEFDAGGRYLVSASEDGTAKLWDVHIEDRPPEATVDEAPRWRVADGRLVAARDGL